MCNFFTIDFAFLLKKKTPHKELCHQTEHNAEDRTSPLSTGQLELIAKFNVVIN